MVYSKDSIIHIYSDHLVHSIYQYLHTKAEYVPKVPLLIDLKKDQAERHDF